MDGGSLATLRARVRAIEGGGADLGTASARLGAPAIDAHLPWGGLPYRALHELGGSGVTALALAFARRFGEAGGILVWCQNDRITARLGALYGPGLRRYDIDPARLMLVRCRDAEETLWALEEALRCPAVVCAVGETGGLDLVASRRLQLAAEIGGGAGLVLQPGRIDPAPNAALTRWRVRALPLTEPARFELCLWRIKGGAPGCWKIGWNEQTLALDLAPELAGHPLAAGLGA